MNFLFWNKLLISCICVTVKWTFQWLLQNCSLNFKYLRCSRTRVESGHFSTTHYLLLYNCIWNAEWSLMLIGLSLDEIKYVILSIQKSVYSNATTKSNTKKTYMLLAWLIDMAIIVKWSIMLLLSYVQQVTVTNYLCHC